MFVLSANRATKKKKYRQIHLKQSLWSKFSNSKCKKETLGWKASRCPWLHEPISGWNTVIDGHYYVGKTRHAVLCPWISLKADSSFASQSLPWVVQIINYHRLHQRYWSRGTNSTANQHRLVYWTWYRHDVRGTRENQGEMLESKCKDLKNVNRWERRWILWSAPRSSHIQTTSIPHPLLRHSSRLLRSFYFLFPISDLLLFYSFLPRSLQ